MADKETVTVEEASHCPKCGLKGELFDKGITSTRLKRFVFACRNDKCTWNDTSWPVDVQPDGLVHVTTRRPKAFHPLQEGVTTEVIAALQRQHDASAKPGTEIRR